jgi:hypothetical protein
MARVLVLTKRVIADMIKDTAFREFSFLAQPPLAKHGISKTSANAKGCGGCRRKPRNSAKARGLPGEIDYGAIKRQIMALPEEQLAALKSRLACTSIKLEFRNQRKRVERHVI